MKKFPYSLPLLLDGATGTMLQKAGMPAGACSETWCMENPQAVTDLQSAYRAAGSDAVLAPTFTANRVNLTQHGVGMPVEDVNRTLAALSRAAVGAEGLVGADMSCTGRLLEPFGDSGFEELYETYLEQAKALEQADTDFFFMETATNLAEVRAAVLACKAVSDKPVFVSMTTNPGGRTFTGTDVAAALVTVQAMGADAYGLNCSVGPELVLEQVQRMTQYAEIPLIAKPNAGLPETVDGQTVYSCAPEELAAFVPALAQAGVGIFGGCCGTTPAHIAALKQALAAVELPEGPVGKAPVACTTERAVFVLTGDEPLTDVLPCTEDFSEDAMEAEEDEILRVAVDSDEALENFAAGCYAVASPLCIVAKDAALLEGALRAYQGVACCQTEGIDQPTLERLHRMYGTIILN